MNDLWVALLSDGSSDQALIPVLKWLLRENGVKRPVQIAWADLRNLPRPPSSLDKRILAAIDLYPCDLLFVHRDAERATYRRRAAEILSNTQAAKQSEHKTRFPVAVPVVPVRMQEAWFLIDVEALRRAAGNPNGRVLLPLPAAANLENIADPKRELHSLLGEASELRGRRLKKFKHAASVKRLADEIPSYAPLRVLQAFNKLECCIRNAVEAQNWNK